MYAVIKTGGKQYRVRAGDVLRVEKLDANVGEMVSFDDVVMVGEGETVQVDPAALNKARVTARVTGQRRGSKIVVFKYKRRKGYRRTQGHRQHYTELAIEDIDF